MSDNGRVIVTGSPQVLSDELLKDLVDHGYKIDRCPEREPTIEDVCKKLPGAVGYLFGGFEYLDANTLEYGDALKVVSLLGEDSAGFLDLAKAKEMGIRVTNTPGATTKAVSEFVIAEILTQSRNLESIVCQGSDRSKETSKAQARELASRRVGIIGLGRIGASVARIMSTGFGAEVCYWNRTRKSDLENALGLVRLELVDLVRSSDILIVSIASHAETEELLDQRLLDEVKEGASLFCVSKSRVIDLSAMLDQLESGRLETAWLDWLDSSFHEARVSQEALQSRLDANVNRLRISGHIANDTTEAWARMAAMATTSIQNFLVDGADQFEVEL